MIKYSECCTFSKLLSTLYIIYWYHVLIQHFTWFNSFNIYSFKIYTLFKNAHGLHHLACLILLTQCKYIPFIKYSNKIRVCIYGNNSNAYRNIKRHMRFLKGRTSVTQIMWFTDNHNCMFWEYNNHSTIFFVS